MKKVILSFVVLFAAVARAHAGAIHAETVADVARSSSTCVPVAVSTPGASVGVTSLTGSQPQASGWRYIKVKNLEGSANVWVNESVSVSTSAAAALVSGSWITGQQGDKVASGSEESYSIQPGQPWYGVCDKTSSTCSVEVCKHD